MSFYIIIYLYYFQNFVVEDFYLIVGYTLLF